MGNTYKLLRQFITLNPIIQIIYSDNVKSLTQMKLSYG